MKITIRKLAALGTAIATTGAAQAGAIHGKPFDGASALAGASTPVILAAGEDGEAGEGGASMDEDMAFHLGVGEIAGKMTVAAGLYAEGLADAAKTHLVRPADAIYTALKPMLDEFNAPGFADELTALADAIDAGAPAGEVSEKLKALTASAHESGAPESPHELAMTIVLLVREAGKDYANGVADGTVTDAHEYQDAWGYVQAARGLLDAAPDWMKEEYGEAFDEIAGYLDGIGDGWPDLSGEKPAGTDPSFIAGTAARIEIVSLRMD